MLGRVRLFLEMIRFSHTVFALPFALVGAVMAWNRKPTGFEWVELLGIVLCMVFARSAAMAFNRLADHEIDSRNPRTAKRHLPTGALSRFAVTVFTLVSGAGFFLSAGLFLLADPPNPWPVYLSVPVLGFVLGYSYTKRFTSLAHFWLGASLMLAPLAAWIAILGMTDLIIPATLGLVVFFWVSGFDILYACQDADFDRGEKLHSVPARFGVRASLWVAFGCHLAMTGCLVAVYFIASPPLGIVYLSGVVAVAVLLLYEHSLVRPDDLTRVNIAFFHVNGLISVGFLVIVLVQLAVSR